MKWITRERPKIDRIACPWLVARLIDKDAEFIYVPAGDVLRIAEETGAPPYDMTSPAWNSPISVICAVSTPSFASIS